MNRDDFQRLAELRLKEAKALLAAGFSEGAYYLAGYAVECALKACIAKRTQQHDFPDKKMVIDSHTHDLANLLRLAELSDQLKTDIALNRISESAWEIVRGWSEQSRYSLFEGDEPDKGIDADMLIWAVESENRGVLPWIKQYW
jgi:HEPN domain-containing protein